MDKLILAFRRSAFGVRRSVLGFGRTRLSLVVRRAPNADRRTPAPVGTSHALTGAESEESVMNGQRWVKAVLVAGALMLAVPAGAQTVSTSDIQRLQDDVYQASSDIS